MPVTALDHYTIRTADLERSRDFYSEIIGLEIGDRPPFKFPGAWLYCGDHPVVHLVGVDDQAQAHTGAIDHLAFRANDCAGFTGRLTERGVAFEERDVPATDLHQVFLRDPDGVRIEINFPGEAQT
jgi:catechol 2,3-dioxygenase-like lactoylglutathione lyase family enzyme